MTTGTTQEERRHVTHITTNLKRDADHDLGAKVLVVGENGAGKSGLVDAFSLVTTGQGRSRGIGKGKELADCGGWDGNRVEVTAELSDGQTLSWPSPRSFEGEDASVRAIDALYSAPKALQSLILSRFALDGIGDQESAQDVWALLKKKVTQHVPEAYTKTLDSLVDVTQTSNGEAADLPSALAKLTTLIDQNRRSVAHEIKQLEGTEAVEPLSVEKSNRIKQLVALQEQVPDFDARGLRKTLLVQSKHLEKALTELKEDIGQSRAAASQEAERIAPQQRRLDLLSTVVPTIDAYLSYFDGWPDDRTFPCPIDGSQVTMSTLRARKSMLTQAIEELGEMLKVHDVLVRTIDDKQHSYAASVQQLTGYSELITQLENVWPMDDGTVPGDLEAELGDLRERRTLGARYMDSRVKIVDLTKRKQELSALLQAAQKTSATETSNVLDIATARVNRLLPTHIRVQIEKVGSMGAGCSLSTKINEKRWVPFRLLGGAERALIGAAVASAFGSKGGTSIDSLIIDDVWLSRPSTTTLISLIDQALAEPYGPSQAILSVVEYQGRIPDDWTVVKLSRELEQEVTSDEEVGGEEAGPVQVTTVADKPGDVPTTNPFGGLFNVQQPPNAPQEASLPDDVRPLPPLPPELPDGLEYMGVFERDAGQSVPVYWLGHFARFMTKSRQEMSNLPTELQTDGVLGIATSGAKHQLKVVTLHNNAVVLTEVSHDEKLRLARMHVDTKDQARKESGAS